MIHAAHLLLALIGAVAACYAVAFVLAAFADDEMHELASRGLQRIRTFARNVRARLWDEFAFRVIKRATRRPPDFIIGGPERPYLRRWWLLPRNRILNVYLHHFLRDDDDRALHDHPWDWCSILLDGAYIEHTIDAGGIHRRAERRAGSVKFSRAERAHRIELRKDESVLTLPELAWLKCKPCWTLFITGPRRRAWGFHCPERGWIPWERFCKAENPGEVGPGCDG